MAPQRALTLQRNNAGATWLNASARPAAGSARMCKVLAAASTEKSDKGEKGSKNAEANKDFWSAEWAAAEKLLATGASTTVEVEMANKGGLVALIGKLKAFIPASQLDQGRWTKGDEAGRLPQVTKLASLVGEKLDVKVIQVDQGTRQLVCSEKASQVDKYMDNLKKDDIRKGIVKSLADFGAFVELVNDAGVPQGVEGLVHVSEISWDRVVHPQEALCTGDEVNVQVINIDYEKRRMGLSIRQLTPDPLLQTLDTLIPVMGDDNTKSSEMPEFPGLQDICATLLAEVGVEKVKPGRQAIEDRVVSQDLEIWLTNVALEDGYNLLVRAGRQVQELCVVTKLDREAIKGVIMRVSNKILL